MRNYQKKIMFNGFSGFKSISYLRNHIKSIPEKQGVYLIIYREKSPTFLSKSTSGDYNGKCPAISKDELKKNWVKDEPIIYIGKAGGKKYKTNLRKRLKQYFDFGCGKSAAHRGGRYIWQLKNPYNLIVAWKTTNKDPDEIETDLISKFKEKHGKRPFANHRK